MLPVELVGCSHQEMMRQGGHMHPGTLAVIL